MERKNHVIDGAFALALFGVFALCAVMLVLLGARVYSKVASGMSKMDAPMILSYVTEKLRSCGGSGNVSLGEDGELLLWEESSGENYATWIYQADGCLMEALMPKGREPITGGGTEIAPVQDFSADWAEHGMLEITVKDADGSVLSRYFTFQTE